MCVAHRVSKLQPFPFFMGVDGFHRKGQQLLHNGACMLRDDICIFTAPDMVSGGVVP